MAAWRKATTRLTTRHPRALGASDVLAGTSVALVLVPQSLAYAQLAGMPAHHGLYAAALPPIAAAFFASSPYLQTGPVAVTSLLTFGALETLALPGSEEYVALGLLLALAVGAMRLGVGLSRSGVIAYLMSHPVLLGFTSAVGVLIVSWQLPTTLGVSAPGNHFLGQAWWALTHLGAWKVEAIAISLMVLLVMAAGRRVHPLFPGVLVAAAFAVAYSVLADYSGPTVGDIPTGLPKVTLSYPWESLPSLVVPALVIALVGFAEPASIARTFAALERKPWDPNREFISQGVANVTAGVTGGFPVGGSFSRSALNRRAGARTRWSGAVAGAVVLAFLPFADSLSSLPKAALGAVLIAAVVGLIRLRVLFALRHYPRAQFLVGWVTFAATLAFAPHVEWGVVVGVAAAIAVHLWRELSLDIDTGVADDTLHLELRGVLWFATVGRLEVAFVRLLTEHPEARHLSLNMRGVGRLDLSGALALAALLSDAKKAGLTVRLEEVPPRAGRLLDRVLEHEAVREA